MTQTKKTGGTPEPLDDKASLWFLLPQSFKRKKEGVGAVEDLPLQEENLP